MNDLPLMEFSNDKRFSDGKPFKDIIHDKKENVIFKGGMNKIEPEFTKDRREYYLALDNMEDYILRKVAQEAKENLKNDKVYLKLKNIVEQIEIDTRSEVEEKYENELSPVRNAIEKFNFKRET
jgi:hypothetical protein